MKEDLLKFVNLGKINPFEEISYISDKESIFKTRDSKAVYSKLLSKISSNFSFSSTKKLFSFFDFSSDFEVIRKRQSFFKQILENKLIEPSSFLNEIKKPKKTWKPRYDILVVTEDESTLIKLREMGCSCQLLISESDVQELERYDIVQVIDCDEYKILLERLPQSVFVNSIEDVYLERYLEELSGWRDNFNLLRKNSLSLEIKEIMEEMEFLFNLMDNKEGKIITEAEAEKTLEEINDRINDEIRRMTISGEDLIKMLNESKMPSNILEIVRNSIEKSGLSEHIFNIQIPLTLDYNELQDQIKRQSSNEFTTLAQLIKKNSSKIKRIPYLIERLSSLLIIEDFIFGVLNFIGLVNSFPSYSNNFHMSSSKNLFISNAQPISFQLDNFSKCSILTGANSGGKTTLLEHIIQNIGLFNLGLPIEGEVHMPLFTDVYYFAKNKGSASKGAFETLLTQMSRIKEGRQTIILADEIEAVTEPGVAGKIISATADYFLKRGCFLVIATHLGYEIQKTLPRGARIDGIEAKGLDENFNLIVDHNPIMGKLAHSTPELIVERMANSNKGEYFEYLNSFLKNS